MKKRILPILLSLALSLSTLSPVAALELEEAKQLLETYYVDPIPEEVLAQDSLDALLTALGDPYTVYLSEEAYGQFISSVDGESLVGIGVSVQTVFHNGFEILSVLPDSPALDAGLVPGDRIIAVDGAVLDAQSDVRSYIAGEEGTDVTVTVVHADGTEEDITLTRRTVQIPIVTYEMRNSAGYIDCTSFGNSTVSTVQDALTELDDQVSAWIMDLRSNPGGTAQAAAGSAGLFIGGATMVYFRYSDGEYQSLYTLPSCPDLTDKPLIVLLSPHSASGSELFAGDIRDYGAGIAIGQRSYGKGVAQNIFDAEAFPDLFVGDAMKITTARFFSPAGATNHLVGVLPTLLISPEHTMAVAQLLSCPYSPYPEHHLKIDLAGQTLCVNLFEATQPEYVSALIELLEALPPSAALQYGNGDGWNDTTVTDLAQQLGLAVTSRSFTDVADSLYRDEIDTLAVYDLLAGYEDNTFRPTQTITRGEFCTILANALALPANPNALTFSDVAADAWYADSVSALVSRGMIAGFEDGTFRPDATITTEQAVTILSAAAAWVCMDGYALSKDSPTIEQWLNYEFFSDWARNPAWRLDELGVPTDVQPPKENLTRESAAALLCSFMEQTHLLWN